MAAPAEPEALFVRLYLDRHIKIQLADDLRARGYEVLTTQEAHLDTAGDEAQLQFATDDNRVILTFNIRDFAPLHQAWLAAGKTHAGIIVSRQLGTRQYGELLRRMLRLLNDLGAAEMRSNLVHLEQYRQ